MASVNQNNVIIIFSLKNNPFKPVIRTILLLIIESVDSISRDGPDIAIYVIHYKNENNSEQLKF